MLQERRFHYFFSLWFVSALDNHLLTKGCSHVLVASYILSLLQVYCKPASLPKRTSSRDTGNFMSCLFDKCGFFNVPQSWDFEGIYGCYPRRLDNLTIFSTFSSVILRSWVVVRPWYRTPTFRAKTLCFTTEPRKLCWYFSSFETLYLFLCVRIHGRVLVA